MVNCKVVLKPGREKSLHKRHPWIFSGAIFSKPDFKNGDLLPVHSFEGGFLALAYFHHTNSIAGRVLSFEDQPLEKALKHNIQDAIDLRRHFFAAEHTNAYRLVNSEGDFLPGLIVDQYKDVLVVQINTCGMESLKPLIIRCLVDLVKPACIYEKSLSSARRQEGLPDFEGYLWGKEVEEVEILEHGLKFVVPLKKSQKTGLFLDQRAMRQWVFEHSLNKRVLNCFSYTGGFSLFALRGGAEKVDSVDICQRACTIAQKNTQLNAIAPERHQIIEADVFNFLKDSKLDYDLVILDPPAFAKKKSDVDAACAGYKSINRMVLEKIPARSLLMTSSCSHHVSKELFQNLIFQAAHEAKRQVRMIGRHRMAIDHPVSIYHPEGEYLKTLLLYISS